MVRQTNLVKKFTANSSREPTEEEITAFRWKYRVSRKYIMKRYNLNKITQEQRDMLLSRLDSASVDNFKEINMKLK
jgi:hypothetical protein